MLESISIVKRVVVGGIEKRGGEARVTSEGSGGDVDRVVETYTKIASILVLLISR